MAELRLFGPVRIGRSNERRMEFVGYNYSGYDSVDGFCVGCQRDFEKKCLRGGRFVLARQTRQDGKAIPRGTVLIVTGIGMGSL